MQAGKQTREKGQTSRNSGNEAAKQRNRDVETQTENH